MKNNKKDYTNSFRELSENKISFEDEEGKAWFARYEKRLSKENIEEKKQKNLMTKSNPKYILRNYLAQEAIEAAQQGDFSALNKLLKYWKIPLPKIKNTMSFQKPLLSGGKNWKYPVPPSCSIYTNILPLEKTSQRYICWI